jgi:hypothetical protein
MRPSLTNLTRKARDAAAGSPVPAGQEPPPPPPPPTADAADAPAAPAATPTTAERGSIRKRARRLQRLREVQLRELGALVVEMKRLDRDNPDLLKRKAAELLALDEELRGLRTALGQRETVEQLVAAGVAGSCRRCATLLSTDDLFCPHCGLATEEEKADKPEASAPPPPPPPPPPAPKADAEPTDRGQENELTATAPRQS